MDFFPGMKWFEWILAIVIIICLVIICAVKLGEFGCTIIGGAGGLAVGIVIFLTLYYIVKGYPKKESQ